MFVRKTGIKRMVMYIVGPERDDGSRAHFEVNGDGHVMQHGLPFWAWLLITGATSSTLSVLLVWLLWG